MRIPQTPSNHSPTSADTTHTPRMSSLERFQSAITVEILSQRLANDVLWRASEPVIIARVKTIAVDTLLALYPTLKSDTGTVLFTKRSHADVSSVLGDARAMVLAHLELLEYVGP